MCAVIFRSKITGFVIQGSLVRRRSVTETERRKEIYYSLDFSLLTCFYEQSVIASLRNHQDVRCHSLLSLRAHVKTWLV